MERPIEDATLGVLQRTLSRAALGASVAATNLANVDTPGYRALEARFGNALGRAQQELELDTSAPGHIHSPGDPGLVMLEEAPSDRMRSDGNTVDVDREMTQLASMQGRYTAAAQLARKRFALLRYAVTDGKGGS